MLLKNNGICLILGIIFENYFSIVSNEFEDHFWLHSVNSSNHLPLYEEIHFLISSYRHSNNLNSTLSSSSWEVTIIYPRICLSFLKLFQKNTNFKTVAKFFNIFKNIGNLFKLTHFQNFLSQKYKNFVR